ncbi:MAG: thioredoxin family protein [Planctomycetota bacterium]|nr:thioredoxin family protein [Planctomycetota bacterium]
MVTICAVISTTWGTPPDLFSDLKFKDAKQASRDQEKYLIVDATAVWCVPCQKMDKTTWVDPRVVSWIDERAIAIQLDVDEEKVGAQMLKIAAMPTIIVFKAGQEFDRVVGYKDADELLTWLDGILEGRRNIDRLREVAGDRMDEEGNVDIDARYELAGVLLRQGEYEEATEEYAWLWENMLKYDQAYVGVRLSYMVGDMKDLAGKHEPAKETFTALRDALRQRIDDGAEDRETLIDWVHLSKVIGEEDDILEWYDRMKSSPEGQKYTGSLRSDIYEIFVERKRWSDAGLVYDDPAGRVEQLIQISRADELPASMDEERKKMILSSMRRFQRTELSLLHAVLLAAGRNDAARRVAEILLHEQQDDDLARFALIKAALDVGVARAEHLAMFEEAETPGDQNKALRKRLEKALQEVDSEK